MKGQRPHGSLTADRQNLTWLVAVVIAAVAAFALFGVINTAKADSNASLNPEQQNTTWGDPDINFSECPTPPEGQEDWYGWHFIATGNRDFLSLSVVFETEGEIKADPFPGTAFIADPDDSHAYVWTETADTLLNATGTLSSDGGMIVLSHFCPRDPDEEPPVSVLAINKTVVTSYDRTHDWSIEKSVDTENGYELEGDAKIWLFANGDGDETATWTIDVTYEGYEDSGHNVSGVISIFNPTLDQDVEILSIVDELAGVVIDIDCGEGFELPHTLAGGDELVCTYSEDVDGEIEGNNVLTVTSDEEAQPDPVTVPIVWGAPTTELFATVGVTDSVNGGTPVVLSTAGPLDAADYNEGDVETFTYDREFTYEGFEGECGSFRYDNTASVLGFNGEVRVIIDSDDATLRINVQCLLDESAWAQADEDDVAFCDAGFNNWGWTNQITIQYDTDYGAWALYAGAGQCDPSKGEHVGYVHVSVDSEGNVIVEFEIFDGYFLDETHVYVGEDPFPTSPGRNGGPTTAPGQYSNEGPFAEGDTVYVIAHAVVLVPDPNFGP